MKFFETSCITGQGIQDLLNDLGQEYNKAIEEDTQVRKVEVFEDKKKGCC